MNNDEMLRQSLASRGIAIRGTQVAVQDKEVRRAQIYVDTRIGPDPAPRIKDAKKKKGKKGKKGKK